MSAPAESPPPAGSGKPSLAERIKARAEKYAVMPDEEVRAAAENHWLKADPSVPVTELRIRLVNDNYILRVEHLEYDIGLYEWCESKRVTVSAAAAVKEALKEAVKKEGIKKEGTTEEAASDSDDEGGGVGFTVHVLVERGTDYVVLANGLIICCNEDPDLNPSAGIYYSTPRTFGWVKAKGWTANLFTSKRQQAVALEKKAKDAEVKEKKKRKAEEIENKATKRVLDHRKEKKVKKESKEEQKVEAPEVKPEAAAAAAGDRDPKAMDDVPGAQPGGHGNAMPAGPIPFPIGFNPTGRANKWAIIVGNKDYVLPGVKKLHNPINDATAFQQLCLGTLGYPKDHVLLVLNAVSKSELMDQIRRFAHQFGNGDRVVFFYAGHGDTVDKESRLLCVGDARRALNKGDCEVDLAEIQQALTLSKMWGLVFILDSCRSTTDESEEGRPIGGADAPGEWRLPLLPNSVHAFACAPGKSANDNSSDNNGRFTKYLIQYQTAHPREDLRLNLARVCQAVMHVSQGLQQPWISASVQQHDNFTL